MPLLNRPDIIDPALLRPGRFDRLLYVPPPDRDSRVQIIKIHTKKKPLADDIDIEELANHTDGYTGADIASLMSGSGHVSFARSYFQVQRSQGSR